MTLEEIFEAGRINAAAIVLAYRTKIETANALPDPQRLDRLAQIQRMMQDDILRINHPLLEMAKMTPFPTIVVSTDHPVVHRLAGVT
jgi:hypothetical protein